MKWYVAVISSTFGDHKDIKKMYRAKKRSAAELMARKEAWAMEGPYIVKAVVELDQ